MTTNLSKQTFYDELARLLCTAEWTRLGPSTGFAALFGRRVDTLVLSLGIAESGDDAERITADFAIAGHTIVPVAYADAPRCQGRVGHFVRPESRLELFGASPFLPGVGGAWWKGRTAANVVRIAEAVEQALPRFVGREGLIAEIDASVLHTEHVERLRRVAETPFDAGRVRGNEPPQEWVDAAAGIFGEMRGMVAATDAWWTFRVLG